MLEIDSGMSSARDPIEAVYEASRVFGEKYLPWLREQLKVGLGGEIGVAYDKAFETGILTTVLELASDGRTSIQYRTEPALGVFVTATLTADQLAQMPEKTPDGVRIAYHLLR